MSELNDPELEELERRLSAAFGGTRPRRGFEDELWSRLQHRGRRWALPWPRGASPRRAWPALSALAAVLIVAVGVVALPRLVTGPGPTAGPQAHTTSAVPLPAQRSGGAADGAARPQQAETAPTGFGPLPAPALVPPAGAAPAAPSQPLPYYGPAQLTVTAQLPAPPATLPVYRYPLPSAADLDAFAARLGASRAGVAGTPTIYRSSDFRLDLTPGSASQEPRFAVSALAPSASPAGAGSRQAADAFLAAHPALAPGWQSSVQVQAAGNGEAVLYQRQFQVPGGLAGQVDAAGAAAGLRVEVAAGSVSGAAGPLPASLDGAQYPTRSSQQAASDAVSEPPAAPSGPTPAPTFQLSRVSLVYVAVGADRYGYFVPAYLFTGTATSGQQTLEKRVLVPALDPSQLR